jgi:hypothetical protein
MTTSFPLCCVAIELSAQLESARLKLDFEWVPPETKHEADDLSNGLVAAFSPELTIPVDLRSHEWRVLGRLMADDSAYLVSTKEAKRSRR